MKYLISFKVIETVMLELINRIIIKLCIIKIHRANYYLITSVAFTKLENRLERILLVSPRFDCLYIIGGEIIWPRSYLAIIESRKVARSHSIVLRDTVTSLPAGSVTRGIADVGGHRQNHGRPASPGGSQVQRCPRRRRNADLR